MNIKKLVRTPIYKYKQYEIENCVFIIAFLKHYVYFTETQLLIYLIKFLIVMFHLIYSNISTKKKSIIFSLFSFYFNFFLILNCTTYSGFQDK